MADIKYSVCFSTVCLFLSVFPSVFCQFNLPGFTLPTVTDCSQGCPPHWSSLIETYASSISAVINNPNSQLCQFISVNQLVSSCNYNMTGRSCGTRQGSLFCCCPVGSQARIVNGCLRNVRFENACVPMDVSPWAGGLLNAFTQSNLGKK